MPKLQAVALHTSGNILHRCRRVSAEDRVKLVDGATKDLDTTSRHLADHNCRILLQSHFDESASRKWVLQMIEIGQKSRETY